MGQKVVAGDISYQIGYRVLFLQTILQRPRTMVHMVLAVPSSSHEFIACPSIIVKSEGLRRSHVVGLSFWASNLGAALFPGPWPRS